MVLNPETLIYICLNINGYRHMSRNSEKTKAILSKQGTQLEIELKTLKLASAIQEPLELLLARNKFNLMDRRIYWWILSKMSTLQTLDTNSPVAVPEQNLVFHIPIRDLYVEIDCELPAKVAKASGKKKQLSAESEKATQGGTETAGTVTTTVVSELNHSVRRGTLNSRLSYSYFKKVAVELIQKSVIVVDHMDTVDPKTRLTGALAIFPRVFYENGTLRIEVDRLIVPAMCSLNKGYTKYKYMAAMSLESEYAQILYVRLCRFLDKKEWKVSVVELKKLLNATNASYNRYSNFKQKILIPTLHQINERTDISVDYQELNSPFDKRATSEIVFTILRPDQGEKRLLRLQTEATLEDIGNTISNVQLQQTAAHIMDQRYSFSPAQQKIIINDEFKLAEFIRLDLQINGGVVKVKTSPTRYIASVLFPTRKVGVQPKVDELKLF